MSESTQELWVKQLEFVQAIIARLAGYGASLKNYCVALVTATVGAAISFERPELGLVAALPIIGFALLDIEYLRTEKRFRDLFNKMRLESSDSTPTFNLDPTQVPEADWLTTASSWSIWLFYLLLLFGVILLVALLGMK
jgi:hypothetical protein